MFTVWLNGGLTTEILVLLAVVDLESRRSFGQRRGPKNSEWITILHFLACFDFPSLTLSSNTIFNEYMPTKRLNKHIIYKNTLENEHKS